MRLPLPQTAPSTMWQLTRYRSRNEGQSSGRRAKPCNLQQPDNDLVEPTSPFGNSKQLPNPVNSSVIGTTTHTLIPFQQDTLLFLYTNADSLLINYLNCQYSLQTTHNYCHWDSAEALFTPSSGILIPNPRIPGVHKPRPTNMQKRYLRIQQKWCHSYSSWNKLYLAIY